jgi:hypothetical protein
MSAPAQSGSDDPQNPTIRAIAVSERREALKGILEQAPVTERSLARDVATQLHGTPSPTDEQVHAARVELVHRHLPLLADVGLCTWDAESASVETTTHSALSDQRFLDLLDLDAEGVDAVLDALAHEYRRIVLIALWAGETEQTMTALAREIGRYRDREGTPETKPIEEIETSLHHAHLPKLAGYDYVEYDPETSRVVYTEHPALAEVLTIIYEPDDSLVDQLDGFLSGLQESHPSSNSDSDHLAGWPHHWGQHHG